jgi:N-hydroxyarylamine O-acetyltransferase
MTFTLAAYLARVGLDAAVVARPPSAALLEALMAAQSRAVAFENLDVVLRRPVSMALGDVAAKLLGGARRGGYCFEQNVLLRAALETLGFGVDALLCRVRWNKRADEETGFTHMALRVTAPGEATAFLADVGFAGTNSIAPLPLDGAAHALPEGRFRAVDDDVAAPGYTALQLEVKGAWRDLYKWRRGEAAGAPDLYMSNFFSCSSPTARFTSQFFVARVVGDARHHILNDVHTVRRSFDGASAVEDEHVVDEAHLVRLLVGVFGLDAPAGVAAEWARSYKSAPCHSTL